MGPPVALILGSIGLWILARRHRIHGCVIKFLCEKPESTLDEIAAKCKAKPARVKKVLDELYQQKIVEKKDLTEEELEHRQKERDRRAPDNELTSVWSLRPTGAQNDERDSSGQEEKPE